MVLGKVVRVTVICCGLLRFLASLTRGLGDPPFLQPASQMGFTGWVSVAMGIMGIAGMAKVLPRVEVVRTNLFDDLLERPFLVLVEFGNQCPLLLPDIRGNGIFHFQPESRVVQSKECLSVYIKPKKERKKMMNEPDRSVMKSKRKDGVWKEKKKTGPRK